MRRRNFIAFLGGAAVAWPLEAGARSVPVVAWVANETASPERLAAFKKGLADAGYMEGENIRLEYRTGKLDSDYVQIMSDMVAMQVTIIVAANAPAAVAARHATRNIPIVMAAVNDPVGLGLVDRLERPGTNVTGTTNYAPRLIAERLQLLKAVLPDLGKVSMIMNGNNANNPAQFALLNSAARSLEVRVQPLDVRQPADVEPAFDKARSYGAQALLNAVDSFINSQRFAIAKLAARYKLPMIYSDREYVLAGGLMSLGPGHQEGYYAAAKYVDQILRGANPAELAVASTKATDLSVSRRALENIGLTLPDDVFARVNDWLE